MSDTPFFSVVIPTYNRANYIRKTVLSVLSQTFQSIEIIVVDDGSTDNTSAVIQELNDPRITYYKKINGERASARNFGTRHANGEYITFLDSDDLFLENHLQEANNTIVQKNFPEIVHLNFMISDIKDGRTKYIDKRHFNTRNELTIGNPFACMGVFLKKEIAIKYPFNEDRNLSATEDYELWIRLSSRFDFVINPTVTSVLVNHNERSVTDGDEIKLVNRKNTFLKYAFEDEKVRKVYMAKYKKIESYCDSYIALHLILAGQKIKSINYLVKSIVNYPLIIFSTRFLVIIKRLLLPTT